MLLGISQALQVSDGYEKLISHKGIVENKSFVIEKDDKNDSLVIAKIKLFNDDTVYSVSSYAIRVLNLIEVGDSVELFSKPITSRTGNFVTNGKAVWNTQNPNELFHIVSKKYDTPIIDFNEHRDNLKNSLWGFPLGSLLFFGWYLYRRSGWKSPFISEHGGWSF